ncbi:sugar transferase [uncultured Ruegeria sp.]|uniref:sugar transferase n=1 Tax=uncultured Ruegeria sp. TaxID=259304 RepID=UPI002625DA99|nr:sugar transferase [uncultured Ruegeria sp.]
MKPIETEMASAEGIMSPVSRPRHVVWTHQAPQEEPAGGWTKRTLDIAIAVTMLVILSPLMAGLALLVCITSPGPVLYRHRRVGYRSQPFSCLKFRTMAVDGDDLLQRHLQSDPIARTEWDKNQKLRDDPRVTPVGHVLRKLSLDELPQLYNVLRGDMSLVGPRPVLSEELRRYGPSSRYYLRARPGITGLWQVNGRNTTSYKRRVAYDRAYVTKVSTVTDIAILAQTLPAAMRSDETS